MSDQKATNDALTLQQNVLRLHGNLAKTNVGVGGLNDLIEAMNEDVFASVEMLKKMREEAAQTRAVLTAMTE